MSDTSTATTEGTSATTEKTDSVQAGTATTDVNTDTSSATSEGDANHTNGTNDNQAKFTQADVDRIIRERLAKAQQAAEKKQQEAQAAAEAEKLREQGEFKALYEEAERKRIEAETKAAQVERARLIDRIAVELGIPEPLRDRIKGETEEELRADATEVAKFIAQPVKREAPETDSQRRGSTQPGEMTDARREELSRRFRI